MTREEAIEVLRKYKMNIAHCDNSMYDAIMMAIEALNQPEIIRCKDCKFFEYDHVENVDGIPLIVAHRICLRWGDGCKTNENGYCFLFEPQESKIEQGLSYADQDTLMSAT